MSSLLLYKALAKFYDLIDVIYFRDQEKSPRKVVLEAIEENDRILDLCTGTATNAINIGLRKPYTKIVGIDFSKDMLRVAKSKVRESWVSNVKLKFMDATKMTFKNQVFDKILVSLVLHELEEPLANEMLLQAKRVLKDDGEIIITEWEPSKQWWRKLIFFPVKVLEPKSYRTFVKKDLKPYFATLGFEMTELTHCDYSKVIKLKKIKK